MISFQSCFTGVESTSKITLSKKDINKTAPTAEELYLSDVNVPTVKDWQPGKKFLVTDDKFCFIVEGNIGNCLQKGDTITYKNIDIRYSAGGGENAAINFYFKGNSISYPFEKKADEAKKNLTSMQLPMLIDLDVVESVKDKLLGKNLWIKSALWYDDDMNYRKGRKFIEVSVEDVESGNSFFPLLVKFRDKENRLGYYLMNIGSSSNDSRSFSKLFSLSDPRKTYNHISEENWKAIQHENLRTGMTKEECRLSKGNPSDTDSGHSYSSTMEIWTYPDGTILRFVDGLLVSFK